MAVSISGCACRGELTFEASAPLRLPPGFNLTLECGTGAASGGAAVSLFTPDGSVDVPRSSHLIFKRCQVPPLPSPR